MTNLPPVRFREMAAGNGLRIGVATLDAPKSLHALSLDMVCALDQQLERWSTDDAMVCVVLDGAGDKAFCAGGDVRALREAVLAQPGVVPNPQALAFFDAEYRLDHRIHAYPKPVLVWGGGIVMGGGLGLLVGASHRVVTETSRLAMPEISIGLYPDVGGSWFLPRMPGRCGLFVGLTGAMLNAHDALYGGLADHCLRAVDREPLMQALPALDWTHDPTRNREVLSAALQPWADAAQPLLPLSNLRAHADEIERLTAGDTLAEIYARIVAYAGGEAWLAKAATTLAQGSPTSAALVWELQDRAASLSLPQVFDLERIVSVQCCAHPDFAEGVRALLVDKDHQPRWTPPALADVTPQWIDGFFNAAAP